MEDSLVYDKAVSRLLTSGEPQALMALLWERLHSYHWKDCPLVYRELWSEASLRRCNSSDLALLESLRVADLGILLGSPCPAHASLIELAQQLHDKIDDSAFVATKRPRGQDSRSTLPPSPSPSGSLSRLPPNSLSPTTAVPRADLCSLAAFSSRFFSPRLPVVIGGMMDGWPAMREWSHLSNLRRLFGFRTVPVETGRSYLDEGAGQQLMTVNAFFDEFLLRGDGRGEERGEGIVVPGEGGKESGAPFHCGYLAQHQLTEQVPELQKAFSVPDYTALDDDDDGDGDGGDGGGGDDDGDGEVVVQSWLGPPHTITPLHFDTSHNLLAQVVGFKYVRLYSPTESAKLCPMAGAMRNNSCVDLWSVGVEGQGLGQGQGQGVAHSASGAEAEFCDVILRPGDMLFIPRGWWHLVVGLRLEQGQEQGQEQAQRKGGGLSSSSSSSSSTSSTNTPHCFSLSFWWGKKSLPSH